jgi:hypothetical protein
MDIESRLGGLNAPPSSEFGDSLRARLAEIDRARPPRRGWRVSAFVAPAVVAGLLASLALPSVRVRAAAFLAQFRVVNFVAVPVDPDRVAALGASQLDLDSIIGGHVDVLQDAVPVDVSTVDQASALAGFDVHVPAWLPAASTVIQTAVVGPRAVRVTGDAARVRRVLDTLGLDDVDVPAALDGLVATVRIAPVVMIRYEHGTRHSRLFQSESPDVALSSDVSLARLGEIGLRMLGLSSDEARRFAASIDWTQTLVVPIPPTAQTFRRVSVDGEPGLVVTYQPPNESLTTLVMWSRGDRVYGLASVQAAGDVLAMADSIP